MQAGRAENERDAGIALLSKPYAGVILVFVYQRPAIFFSGLFSEFGKTRRQSKTEETRVNNADVDIE